jgi:uncharacterized membrane protein
MRKTTMFKKILTATVLTAALAGAVLATSGSAEARYGNNGAFGAGAALGLLGGALAGAAYNNSYQEDYQPVYYRRCHIERRRVSDYYGWHWERVRVCY